VLTLINSDLFFQMVPLPTLTLSVPASDYRCVKINFQKQSHLPFLNVYSPPTRNTQLESRYRTFSPELLPNSSDKFILGYFNAHHPTWDTHISPESAGNSLQLDILNDPGIHTLLHHSSGSRSYPDVSLAPSHFAPTCEWRTLSGLGSDHLLIDISLQLAPICHTNTRAPAFNFKKAHWEEFEKFISVYPLPPIEETQNIYCVARSFSSFPLNAAKAYIPFGRLGHPPKAWWSEEAKLAVRDRRRARSRHIVPKLISLHISRRHGERPQSSPGPKPRPGRPPATTCPPDQTSVLFSISLTQLLARRVLPATQNFRTTKDTANIYASYLRSHFSTNSPPLSWC